MGGEDVHDEQKRQKKSQFSTLDLLEGGPEQGEWKV